MTIRTKLPDFVTDEYLRHLILIAGKGDGAEGSRCSIQEQRSWYGADPSSDSILDGDSRSVARYIIGFQDRIIRSGATPEQVYELVGRHLPKLRGSYGSAELEQRRAFLLSDMLIRELAPLWFDLTPELAKWATSLRALDPITDRTSLGKALAVRDAARAAGWKARSKVYDGLAAKVTEALRSRAKPEGLSDRLWKRICAAADADAAAAAAADAAAAAAAVADAAAAAVAVAVAAAAADADAVAVAAAVADAVAVAVARREDESDEEFVYRAYWAWRNKLYSAVYTARREAVLAKHRELVERSWALGGRFIEQALALKDEA